MLLQLLLCLVFFFLIIRPPPSSTLFPYTTLFRSQERARLSRHLVQAIRLLSPRRRTDCPAGPGRAAAYGQDARRARSEEHTSELQSRRDLVCRLLLEKKKKQKTRLLVISTATYTY